MSKKHSVKFISANRKPQCEPNPDYPNGKNINMSDGRKSCLVDLPYPAEGCGVWMVNCSTCGMSVAVTAAGRSDDPKSLRFSCAEVMQ